MAMNVGTNISGAKKINVNDFGDLLTFLVPPVNHLIPI